MLARIRGSILLVYAAVGMVAIFLVCLPVMLLTGSGDSPIRLGRRLWAPIGLWLAGAKLDVVRPPELPAGPAIFASNHESGLDIWVLFVVVPRAFRFIAKQELYRIPIFGWYMRIGGHIPVDRSNHTRAVASLAKAAEAVRGGTSIVVFPEGTRSRTGRVQPFKKGPFVVAKEAGVPIIPIAISGSGAVTPSKKIAVHPGTIRVAAGDPVDPAAFPDKEALLEEVRARIVALHRSLGGLGGEPVPGARAAAPRGGEPAKPTP
jgi:1-acyl-sn-glycerol-3-phosphate acyltransferase